MRRGKRDGELIVTINSTGQHNGDIVRLCGGKDMHMKEKGKGFLTSGCIY